MNAKRRATDPDFWARWEYMERDGGRSRDGLLPPVPESMREAVLERLDEWARMKARAGKAAMLQKLRRECYDAERCLDQREVGAFDPAHALADRMLFGLLAVG